MLKNKLFLLSLIITYMFAPYPSYSNESEKRYLSSKQDIAFLFYKMIGQEPDYRLWTEAATQSDLHFYGELGKRDFINENRKRIINNYNSIDPENSLIVIDKFASLEAIPIDKSQKEQYFINIYFQQSPPFIAQRIPGYNISYVIPALYDELQFVMSDDSYKDFDSLVPNGLRRLNTFLIRMYLKPIKIDLDKPLIRNDMEYTMLLTKMIKYEIRNEGGHELYWPLPSTEEEITKEKEEKQKNDFFSKYK